MKFRIKEYKYTSHKKYEDPPGTYIEIREDQDGLDMIEIIYKDENDKVINRFPYLTLDQVNLLTDALMEVSDHILNSKMEKNNE